MIGDKTAIAAYVAQQTLTDPAPATVSLTDGYPVRVDDLVGRRLDYYVARALGYRFWREKRGEYDLAVVQNPGEREPYRKHQRWMEAMEKYREVFDYSDLACGFYGNGIPEFSRTYAIAGQLIDQHMISAEPIFHLAEFGSEHRLVLKHWHSMNPQHRKGMPIATAIGPTRLIASMRALLKGLVGPEVTER